MLYKNITHHLYMLPLNTAITFVVLSPRTRVHINNIHICPTTWAVL